MLRNWKKVEYYYQFLRENVSVVPMGREGRGRKKYLKAIVNDPIKKYSVGIKKYQISDRQVFKLIKIEAKGMGNTSNFDNENQKKIGKSKKKRKTFSLRVVSLKKMSNPYSKSLKIIPVIISKRVTIKIKLPNI